MRCRASASCSTRHVQYVQYGILDTVLEGVLYGGSEIVEIDSR